MEILQLEGLNPDDWLLRVEKCFVVNQSPENEKLDQALSRLGSTAVSWWRFYDGRENVTSWPAFKEKFRERFKPSRERSSTDHLLSIEQTGNVRGVQRAI